MSDALLVFHIDIKVPHHDHATEPANAFLATTEFPRFHVSFHDVDSILLVKRYAGDFIEADHIILADQAALAIGVVYKHLGHSGLGT